MNMGLNPGREEHSILMGAIINQTLGNQEAARSLNSNGTLATCVGREVALAERFEKLSENLLKS